MRIDLRYGPQSTPDLENKVQDGTTASGTAPSKVQQGEDLAQLSGAHVQVQALASQASQLPEVRDERVQSLRQSVLSGEYRPDPEKVGAALLSYMTSGGLSA
jgi:flagellar biosynthesis anti-sigma factor FlgM